MKRIVLLSVILAAFSTSLWADLAYTLGKLEPDVQALMTSLGEDIAPNLLQTALGSDIVGEAALKGGFPHCTFTLFSVGADLGNGIATALNNGATDWEFTYHMDDMVTDAVGDSGTSRDAYDASRNVFPYPSIAAGIGFGLTKNYDILVSGFYLPQSLTDKLVDMAPSKIKDMGVTFDAMTVVVKLRRILFHDGRGTPAMSIALGGVYGKLDVGVDDFNSTTLKGSEIEVPGVGKLDMTGTASFQTRLYGAGIEFAISKRIAYFFIPYANVGAWYRHAEVSSNVDFVATLTDSNEGTSTVDIVSNPKATSDGISGRVGAGMELHILPFYFHLGASLDLEDPIVNVSSFTLTGISANELSLNAGLRMAF
jgi:hypothetical protein